LPNSTKYLQRTAYIQWMAVREMSDLGSEITLFQHGFADESVTGPVPRLLAGLCEAICPRKVPPWLTHA
jgi:hypothetical protein